MLRERVGSRVELVINAEYMVVVSSFEYLGSCFSNDMKLRAIGGLKNLCTTMNMS